MPGQPSPSGASTDPAPRRDLYGKVARYAAGSVVATVCSEVTFVLLYGVVHTSAVTASVLGWLAGAVPNYWLNRSWTWQRRGRPSLSRELLPYLAIVLGTLLVASLATSAADHVLTADRVASGVRVVAVGGTFLGVYGLVFLVRFFLLDRLFGRAAGGEPPGSVDPVSAREPV